MKPYFIYYPYDTLHTHLMKSGAKQGKENLPLLNEEKANKKERVKEKKMMKSEEVIEKEEVKKPGRIKRIFSLIGRVLPYGTAIEKIYLLVILVAFILAMFKSGSVVSEDKVLLLVIAAGGLFILRSLRRKIYFPKRYTIFAGIFLILSVVSTLLSINVYNSLLGISMIFAAILFSIIGYDVIYGKYSRRWILNALTLALSILLLISIYFYIKDKNVLLFPLGFPLYMGALISAFIPFSLSSAIKTKGIKQALFYIALLILLTSTILTYSVPVYVIVSAEVILFLVLNLFTGRKVLRKRRYLTPITAVIVVSLAAGILLHFTGSGQIPFGPNSYADRVFSPQLQLAIFKQGWDAFRSSFVSIVFGSGLENFKVISLYHQAAAWNLSYHLNSDIGEMFVSEGVLGGIAFIALLGYVVYEIFRKKNFVKIFKKQNNESMEVSIGILALMLFALFTSILHVVAILLLFFLFIGILLKDLNVDSEKRYYMGNLSIGLVNGLALFFIVLCLFFYITNMVFQNIRNNISSANLASSQKQVEEIVRLNPVDSEYASYLSQIYLAQNQIDQAMSLNNNALQFNRQSPYLRYSDALMSYFKNDNAAALKKVHTLLSEAPYADPSFYLLPLQIDQQSKNDAMFKSDLEVAVKRFPANTTYFMYQPVFSDLGFSDSLSKLYIELGLLTNNQSYFKTAQQVDPQGFSGLVQ